MSTSLLVAIGVATAAAAAPTVGLLPEAVGPESPAIPAEILLAPCSRPAFLLAVPTSALVATPRAAVAASPPPAVAPPVQAAIPHAAAPAAIPPRDAALTPAAATISFAAVVGPVAPPASPAAPAVLASVYAAYARAGWRNICAAAACPEQDAHAVRLLMPRSRPTTAPRPRPDFLYPCSPPLPHLSAPPLLVLSPLVPTPPAPLSIP